VKELDMFHDYETQKNTRNARKPAIIAGRITKQHVIIIIITCCSVVLSEKITRKAGNAAENLQL